MYSAANGYKVVEFQIINQRWVIQMQINLSGKTALVTGASQGLGREIAKTLCSAGANVAVNYFADPDGVNLAKANDVVAELGERAFAVAADVRSFDDAEKMVATVTEKFGGLLSLIHI